MYIGLNSSSNAVPNWAVQCEFYCNFFLNVFARADAANKLKVAGKVLRSFQNAALKLSQQELFEQQFGFGDDCSFYT